MGRPGWIGSMGRGGYGMARAVAALAMFAAAISGCTAAPLAPASHRLTADEIRAALVGTGTTAEGTDWQGNSFTLFIAPDGTARYRDAGLNDTGIWRITAAEDGDRWCSKWTLRRKGAWACDAVLQDGDRFFFASDGRTAATMRLKAGNAAHLDGAAAIRK